MVIEVARLAVAQQMPGSELRRLASAGSLDTAKAILELLNYEADSVKGRMLQRQIAATIDIKLLSLRAAYEISHPAHQHHQPATATEVAARGQAIDHWRPGWE